MVFVIRSGKKREGEGEKEQENALEEREGMISAWEEGSV